MANGEAVFQGNDAPLLVDIEQLCQVVEEQKAEEEDATRRAAGQGEGLEPHPKRPRTESGSPKKVKVWVDRDRIISATARSASKQCKAFQTKVEVASKSYREKLQEFKQNTDEAFCKNFQGELKIFGNRVEALGLVAEQALVIQ